MPQLIRIGNSQGLRIPRPLIEQGMLEGKELSIEAFEGGDLLIRPLSKGRSGWVEQIQMTLQENGEEPLNTEWLDAPLTDEGDLWE